MKLSNLSISYYDGLMMSLNVAKNHGVINIAKPVFLLTIISCIEDGSLLGNKIMYTEKLESTYCNIYKKFRDSKITSPIYPYYYLNHEEFYHIKGDTSRETPSKKFIKENIEYSALDDKLWEMLQDKNYREHLRSFIINHYLQ